MSAAFIGIICIALLLVMLFMGLGIGISLISISLIGVILSMGDLAIAVDLLGTTSYSAIKDYSFAVIPLFVLMGLFASESGAGTELYDSSNQLLKRVRGGVAMATVLSNAVFAAITGASIASAAVFSKVAFPEMMRLGYNKRLASGTIAGSSVLGMLIPPSILMIVYGSLANVSIGKLFIAGIIPGIILAAIFILMIAVVVRVKPEMTGYANSVNNDIKINWKIVFKPWAFIITICLVLGGMWGGIFTPTEAGGAGAFCTLVLLIVKKRFTWATFWNALKETGKTSGSILFLLISAQMFSRMLAISGVVGTIGDAILALGLNSIAVIVIFCLIQILLGCILDSTSIILLTAPIVVPVINGIGLSPVWYGVVMIVAVEMGLISPPFGISAFTVKSSLSGMKLKEEVMVNDIFIGAIPFLAGMLILLILIVLFPPIVTFLTDLM